jgi:hypothetical protein
MANDNARGGMVAMQMPTEPPEVPPPTPGTPTEPPPGIPPGNPRPEVPPPVREPGAPPRPDELPGEVPEEFPERGPSGPQTPNPATDARAIGGPPIRRRGQYGTRWNLDLKPSSEYVMNGGRM